MTHSPTAEQKLPVGNLDKDHCTADETNATPRATYVCPQCGPDPAGEELHAKRSHALDSLFATAHETVRERHNPLREPVEHCSVCGEPGCPDHM